MLLQTWESADKIVRKDIIKPGQFCKKPSECSTCEVIINNINVTNATLHEMRIKSNSEILNGANEKSIIIGEANCEVDYQIERGIQMMMAMETSLITINVSLEGIVERLIIKFEITLNKIHPYKPIWEWSPEEKYSLALKHKEIGVQLFKDGRSVDAFHRFSKACKFLITLEPIPDLELDAKLESDINNLRLVLYNNMAGCQLNQKNFEHVIALCSKVLSKDNNNVKALYRRGVAHGNLRDLEKAVIDLKNAVNLEPSNQAIKEQFAIYNAKWLEANKRFEDMVKRMFKT